MTLLYGDPLFLEHETGAHPESPQRLRSIWNRLDADGLSGRCTRGETRLATTAEIARSHDPAYIEQVQQRCRQAPGRIEADTVVSRRSFDAAALAAGTALAAVDAVIQGVDQTALCLVRPPGHHALHAAAMGFCLFNNVALAAEHALHAHHLRRVLIVDWDVHHGNGTQDMFYERDDVWFFSAHRSPFYPGTGDADETGSGRGLGATFNLPLKFGVSRQEYLARFESMLRDAADRCRPELLLLSAGFDAHRDDPVGDLGLETEDFIDLTKLVRAVARQHCRGRLVSLLEGGYDVNALADSVAAHLETLLTP
ncbi:MAG: histone deacetylase [Planctomycetaceae bacterium]